jgi:hypothetical protein
LLVSVSAGNLANIVTVSITIRNVRLFIIPNFN